MSSDYTVHRFIEQLRQGPYTFPGGYPVHFILSDGESLCFACAKEQCGLVARAIRDQSREGWRAVAADIDWEDGTMQCAHCNKPIECAYPKESEL